MLRNSEEATEGGTQGEQGSGFYIQRGRQGPAHVGSSRTSQRLGIFSKCDEQLLDGFECRGARFDLYFHRSVLLL